VRYLLRAFRRVLFDGARGCRLSQRLARRRSIALSPRHAAAARPRFGASSAAQLCPPQVQFVSGRTYVCLILSCYLSSREVAEPLLVY
jgi:hypothetical protein